MNDMELEQQLRRTLDARVDEPDELTRAALRAARYRALEKLDSRPSPWWRAGMVTASVLAVSMLGWQLTQTPGDLQGRANAAEDAAVIADLDLVLWLEEGEV